MNRTMGSRFGMAAIACALACASPVFGQTSAPATGLGQAWPNAADVSTSPRWHVYVFRLHGIKYIQINDRNGIVRAAIGMAAGTSIVLPVGVDAQQVTTTTTTGAMTNAVSSVSETVYQDATMIITATPQSNGTMKFAVASICQDPYNCGGGG
jgi:hypothetical protein